MRKGQIIKQIEGNNISKRNIMEAMFVTKKN